MKILLKYQTFFVRNSFSFIQKKKSKKKYFMTNTNITEANTKK